MSPTYALPGGIRSIMNLRLTPDPEAIRLSAAVTAPAAMAVLIAAALTNHILLRRMDVTIGLAVVAVVMPLGVILGSRLKPSAASRSIGVLSGLIVQAVVVASLFEHPGTGFMATILTLVTINQVFLFGAAFIGTRVRNVVFIGVLTMLSIVIALHVAPQGPGAGSDSGSGWRQIATLMTWSVEFVSLAVAALLFWNRTKKEIARRAQIGFFQSMGHDLRTPLSTILGLSHLAQEKSSEPVILEQLTNIVAAAEHLKAVFDSLTLIGDIRGRKVNTAPDTIRIEVLVTMLQNRVTAVTQNALPRGDVCGNTKCVVLTNSNILVHAFTSLAIARTRQLAVDSPLAVFTACGGEDLLLGIGTEEEIPIIRECGPGMSPTGDMGPHGPGNQDSEAVLYVVRLLLQETGASLERCGIDDGHEIPVIRIPASSLLEASSDEESCGGTIASREDTMAEPPAAAVSALYIEDNLGNQSLMKAIFDTQAGWKLVVADTAEAGIELCATTRPDVVLMDIGLPGMSGCEATARLNENQATRSIPVIAVTADVVACADERPPTVFDAVVTKPFTPSGIVEEIRRVAGA